MQIVLILFSSFGLLSSWTSGVTASFLWPHKDAIENTVPSEIDFTGLLNAKNLNHDIIFSEALRLLELAKSSSSCSRAATANLVTSCQLLEEYPEAQEESTQTWQSARDRVKSLYAARLALCELASAGTSIPSACSSLDIRTSPYLESIQSWKSGSDKIKAWETVLYSTLEPCLKSLESRPQWWTSYSNNRQNAVVICQAARNDIETTQLLELHRSLTEHTASVNEALQNALHNAAKEASHHRDFVAVTSEMRNDLVREFDQSASETRTLIMSWLNSAETAISSAVRKILSVVHDVESESSALSEDVKSSSNELIRLRNHLRQVRDENIELGDKLGHAQREAVSAGQDLSLALRSSMNSFVTNDMARLSETVNSVEAALEWLSKRFNAIHEQENLVLQNLQNFEKALNESQIKARELLDAQIWQAQTLELHSKMQMDVGENAKIAHAMLERLTAKAANLETVLEEAQSRAYDFPAFGTLLGAQFSPWTLCSLLLACLAVQSPRMTLLSLVGACFFIIYKFIY